MGGQEAEPLLGDRPGPERGLTGAGLPLTAAVSLAEKLTNSAHSDDWVSLSNWAAAIFPSSALALLSQQEPGTGNHQQLLGVSAFL